MNGEERHLYREEMRAYLVDLMPNYFLTFNFNYVIKPAAARSKMTNFFNATQSYTYGRDWCKQRDRPWPVAYGFLEHPDSNPHYHVLAAISSVLALFLTAQGPALWRKQVCQGELDIQELQPPGKVGPVVYSTKDLIVAGRSDEIFIYSDTRG